MGISAVDVVVLAQQVHGLEQLVVVDEGTDHNEGTQDAPAPEGAGTEAVGDVAALQLSTDAVGESVGPGEAGNAEGQPGVDEGHQQEVGGLLAVVAAGDDIDVGADAGHDHQAVDAQGQDVQQNELDQTTVGLQLDDRSHGSCSGIDFVHGFLRLFFLYSIEDGAIIIHQPPRKSILFCIIILHKRK